METYHNNYELTFKFEKPNSDKVETFKVPYPFAWEQYNDDEGETIFFDYRLFTLANNNKKLERKFKELSVDYPKSKYFDTILKIPL